MKKLLKKLPFVLFSWCLTLAILIVMIIMSVRPISYGWKYKGEADYLNNGSKQEISLTFEDDDELELFFDMEDLTFKMGMWYIRNGVKYSVVGPSYVPTLVNEYYQVDTLTESEFETEVKETKGDRQKWREIWAKADKINAFKCEVDGEEFTCFGAIVFVVICGVLCVSGLVLSVFSTLAYTKAKKEKQTKIIN